MKVAASVLVLALGLAGCARHGSPAATAPTAPSRTATPSIAELTVTELPRGFLPPRARRPTSPLDRSPPPGVLFDMKAAPPRLSGVHDAEATFDIDLRDPRDAANAYCFAPEEVAPPDDPEDARKDHVPGFRPAVKLRLPWFAIPMVVSEGPIRAERVTAGPAPRLETLSLWATDGGESKLTAQNSVPLRPIGGLGGVEVFAFQNATETRHPTVDFVVRRPPLTKGLARYASFLLSTTTQGATSGSCTHARVELPLTQGGGESARVDVAVETTGGVRRMQVHVGTLWLPEERSARVSARLDWAGPEVERLVLEDPEELPARNGGRR